MKRLSKAQRRALEIANQGRFHKGYIHPRTHKWLIRNSLAVYIAIPMETIIGGTRLTDKGKSWLDHDRALCPVVQCKFCGNWHDIDGEWEDNIWVWRCNGIHPDHYGQWHDYENYPDWIEND
jgi:hypothetical protein